MQSQQSSQSVVNLEAIPATVQVIWGPIVKDLATIGGLTVGAVYRGVREAFGIPTSVSALVNGERARSSRALVAGDVCEFVKRAGEKGAS